MKVKPTSAIAKNAEGFSLIELLIVVVLIAILSTISLIFLTSAQRLTRPDDQSLQIADILQEARQRALTQRVTMRVQIDITANVVRLINEQLPNTANDDVIIRQVPLLPNSQVRVNPRPDNIPYNPPEPLPAPTAVFLQSTYPLSPNNQVCTLRFRNGGDVVNAGNNDIGGGAIPQGVTLHVWSPTTANPNVSEIARSITVIGSTGSIRLWKFNPASIQANRWEY